MVEQIEKLIPLGHPNRPGIKINPIAIVVHYTANSTKSADDLANVNYIGRKYETGYYLDKYNNKTKGIIEYGSTRNGIGKKFRYGSAHKFIDKDSCTTCIPTDEVTWNCGDRPLNYNNGYKGQTKIAKEIFDHKQNYLSFRMSVSFHCLF